ncbi:VOC family protein [Arenimonas sp.]|uniref:VOC family protein n=1 Tax=Arenimonas sp. TaxID=1872635 RepID=UPI0039E29A45
MNRHLAQIALLVDDYDTAIAHYTQDLGFLLLQDEDLGGGKRWVLVAPSANSQCALLLARASTPRQSERIGDQTGGRVGFFLHTDDFDRDHAAMTARGVRFVEAPRDEAYGKVVVFEDRYGNRWDLIERRA